MSHLEMSSEVPPSKPGVPVPSPDLGEDRSARLHKYSMLEATASSRIQSPEAKQWFEFVSESRLRIDNLRTMAHLNMMSPKERFVTTRSRKLERSGIASLEAPSIPYLPDELVALLDQLKQKGFDISAHPELPRNQRDPIQCLSDDLLIQIFSYLSYPEIIAAQRVSRSWLYYLVTEPYLHRNVSFVTSKHQISLRTLRTVLAMADGRVLSLEFSAGTLMHLTPLVLMYPHLQRLVIEHNSNIMSTIFSIAFQVSFGSYHQLPNLRTAIITHGVLQKNELITLISMAPNLEEFQCRKAVVKLDLLEFETALENCRIKRLRIKAYSERTKTPDRHELNSRQTNLHSRQSPLILRFMPLLEELVLGIEYMQTLDLSANQRIRYVDFTRHTHVVSFIQPPQSLEVCLNAPHLNATNFRAEITDDFEAANDGPDGDLKPWTDPPRFKRLSLVSPPLRPSIFSRAVCNSYVSLESLSVSSSSNGRTDSLGLPLPDNIVSWENEKLFLNVLGDHLILFLSLRQLNVQSGLVGEPFLSRVAQLTSLEYFSIAGAGVHALHVLHFLESSRSCPLKEVNVQGSMAGQQLQGYDGEEVEMTIKFKVAVVAKERGIILKTGLPPRRPYDVVYDMY